MAGNGATQDLSVLNGVLHKHAGPQHIVDSMSGVRKAEAAFWDALALHGRLVGLDMEWLPDRCATHNHKIALVQLALGDAVWLIRTCRMNFQLPAFVRKVLQDPSVMKATVDFSSSDQAKLKHSFAIDLGTDPERYGVLDLSAMARKCTYAESGLKRLAARYGYRIAKSKKMSLSDWEAARLSDEQVQYAADDAYFSLLVVGGLLREDVFSIRPSTMYARASEAWQAVKPLVLKALAEEDSSEKDAAIQELVSDTWRALQERAATTGEDMLTYAEAQRLIPPGRAKELGVVAGKAFFKEQRGHFDMCERGGQTFVRPRTALERAPPSEAALSLPWEGDAREAVLRWCGLERELLGPAPNPRVLRYRLLELVRVLEARGAPAAGKEARKWSEDAHRLAALVSGAELELQANAKTKETKVEAAAKAQPQAPATASVPALAQGGTQDPPTKVFIGGLDPSWDEPHVRELAAALLGPVLRDVAMPPGKGARCNRGYAFFIFHGAAAAAQFLNETGATHEAEGAFLLGGKHVGARPFR